jgi:hypothetical protein
MWYPKGGFTGFTDFTLLQGEIRSPVKGIDIRNLSAQTKYLYIDVAIVF